MTTMDQALAEQIISDRLKVFPIRLQRSVPTPQDGIVARRELTAQIRNAASRRWGLIPEFASNVQSCVDHDTAQQLVAAGVGGLVVMDLRAYYIPQPVFRWEYLSFNRPDSRQLHCDDGPAVISDVVDLYYIHGVEVPKEIVLHAHLIELEHIEKERNQEVKRIMIERWPGGWEKYLAACGNVIDQRFNERDQQHERLYEHHAELRLSVRDPSTGRRYALGVPRTVRTCEEAQRWLSHGLDARAIHRS